MSAPAVMICRHHAAGRCRSCTWLGRPYHAQVAEKQRHSAGLLEPWPSVRWEPPVPSRPEGFRTKAKMAVAGTVEQPTLGLVDVATGAGTDLRDCGLHTPGLRAALPVVAELVTRARLTPYDVAARRGELKHVLLTEGDGGALLMRLVLRSTEAISRIRKHLGWLQDRLPQLAVATVNLQPAHKAVLEGPDELVLTAQAMLPLRVGDHLLHVRPQGFTQTNTEVAGALYRTARAWLEEPAPRSVWDLYCGAGGFALHLAGPERAVTGVEVSEDGVRGARQAALEAGLGPDRVSFEVGDATAWADAQPAAPDVVVVNPPRRGLGAEMAAVLDRLAPAHLLYSSCHPGSLARDLALLSRHRPVRAQVFDMFPQTAHHEVLVLLAREP